MNCWRFYLRRKFVPYLEGALPPPEAKRVDTHLQTCEKCRTMFVRLRAGHQLARQLRPLIPDADRRPPAFETMMADADELARGRSRLAWAWETWLDALTTPRMAMSLAVLVLVLAALLVVSNRRILFGERNGVSAKLTALDFSRFRSLSIPEFPSNTTPHIATEGYVRDVRVDSEEKTLHFKLAEIPQGPGPFVVCEIMSPNGMAVPREGSRVRVYGVARFDAQTGRQWQEVNPVLNIAVLKR
jgi:hypothetical protein